MSSKQISAGELAVGQFITVLEWIPWSSEMPGDGFLMTKTVIHTDYSWCGDVLKVLAVDLPYVAVQSINETWMASAIQLDTRRVKLMELSPEYVAATKRL
jgi:hypothetical protein